MNEFACQSLLSCFCLFLLWTPLALGSAHDLAESVSSLSDTPITTASIEFGQDAVWQVPTCQKLGKLPKGKRITTPTFQFIVPDNLLVKKVTDADYIEYLVSRKAKHKVAAEYLEVWFGTTAALTNPPQDLMLSSATSRRRYWSCEKLSGSDLRGDLTDGTRWRWISLPMGVANYRTKSRELADAFDSVIESFCCKLEPLDK
jgi:hypothetical protein